MARVKKKRESYKNANAANKARRAAVRKPDAKRCGLCGVMCTDPTEVSRHHKDTCSRYPDNAVHYQTGADSCKCGNLWPCTRMTGPGTRVNVRNSAETRAAIAAGHEPGVLARVMADPSPTDWYIKDVITRAKDLPAHKLVTHRQQNEVTLSCGVGSAVRTRIMKENDAINTELARRRQLDSDSLLREESARRELDRQQRAKHTCIMKASSMGCRACNTGVPYPHETEDDRLVTTRKALVEKVTDAVRRIDRELAQLRQDLDRLRDR